MCWLVIRFFDCVFDGVVEAGDGLSLVSDLELPVAGGDGCGDESSDRNAVGYGPVGERDFDGVTVGDVPDERDTSLADGEGQVAFSVEIVGDRD